MAFKLADLFVQITGDSGPLNRTLGAVHRALTGLAATGGALAAGGIAAGIAGLGYGLVKGVMGASDLNETLSKVGVVFGPAAASVEAQAQQMADSFGLPKQAVLDAAASIGLIGKAAGQSQAQAGAMANQMAKLAADASSFYNVPLEDALEKIRSGLVGESEPIRAFGVLLSEAAVQQEALRLGIVSSADEMTEQTKVMARASLIAKGLADATGDLERTQDSTSNQLRKLTGGLGNLATTVGQALLPAVNAGVSLLNEFASAATAGFGRAEGAFQSFASGVTEVFNTVGVIFRNLPLMWEIVSLKFQEGAHNILAVLGTIPDNLAIIGNYIANNWYQLIRDAVVAVGSVFHNLGTNLGNLAVAIQGFFETGKFSFDWTPLLDGFKATAEKLPELLKPELISMQAEIDKVTDRIAGKELKRQQDKAAAAAAANTPAAPGDAGGDVAAGKKKKGAEVESLDSFAKGLLSAAFGGKDKAQERTAAAAEKTAAGVQALVEAGKRAREQYQKVKSIAVAV